MLNPNKKVLYVLGLSPQLTRDDIERRLMDMGESLSKREIRLALNDHIDNNRVVETSERKVCYAGPFEQRRYGIDEQYFSKLREEIPFQRLLSLRHSDL